MDSGRVINAERNYRCLSMSETETAPYNHDLCEERHRYVDKEFVDMDGRIRKVENRFLAIITALVLNLVGVITLLLRTG